MDGWTDPAGRSIYNYVALTSNGKEYLLKLMDYSQFSHTADFLANEIEQTLVLNNIGVVTDGAGNVRNAGRPPNIVWTHFNKGTERYPGKYDSTCIYCNDNGTKGSPQLMQEHLANRCPNVPVDVKQVFLEIILHKHQDDNFFDATDSLTTSNSSNKKFV
ncbi:450_t:CDS:2 [Entrophospora sp. SA101]|nr:450_t:CDS:2 [Entrophospora sp. SA101]